MPWGSCRFDVEPRPTAAWPLLHTALCEWRSVPYLIPPGDARRGGASTAQGAAEITRDRQRSPEITRDRQRSRGGELCPRRCGRRSGATRSTWRRRAPLPRGAWGSAAGATGVPASPQSRGRGGGRSRSRPTRRPCPRPPLRAHLPHQLLPPSPPPPSPPPPTPSPTPRPLCAYPPASLGGRAARRVASARRRRQPPARRLRGAACRDAPLQRPAARRALPVPREYPR